MNSLQKKTPDVTTLIHINQYNTDKQNLKKKIGDVDKKTPATKVQWLQLFRIQKLVKLRKNYQTVVV